MERICEKCKNFIQHYGIEGGRIFSVGCGHCTVKDCEASLRKRVCKNFEKGEVDNKNQIDVFSELIYIEEQLKNFTKTIRDLKLNALKIVKENKNCMQSIKKYYK